VINKIGRFSRTLRLANAIANLSVCRLWRACTLHRGFNFSGIFPPYCSLATKNHESRRSSKGSPPPSKQISLTGVWLCDSS